MNKLRESISAIVSNSFIKCKKKLIDDEIYLAQKSLFHCFRITYYGIQLAKGKKIHDYTGNLFSNNYISFKKFFEEIQQYSDWNDIKNKYNKMLNEYLIEFRKNAPKYGN